MIRVRGMGLELDLGLGLVSKLGRSLEFSDLGRPSDCHYIRYLNANAMSSNVVGTWKKGNMERAQGCRNKFDRWYSSEKQFCTEA